jgi:uncharacterized protein (DUF488 family)
MSSEKGEEGSHVAGTIYTLGTSTRTLQEFTAILKHRGITQVCDVRSFPTSRRYPHFSSQVMAVSLEKEGISYRWLGEELGGFRKGGYLAYTQTGDFMSGLEELEKYASREPTAIICAELLPWRCHRRYISRSLSDRGWKVVHVIDLDRDWVTKDREKNLSLWGLGDE